MKTLILDRELKRTQTKFKYKIEEKHVTQQSSYNLSIDVEETLRHAGALKKVEDGVFCISDNFNVVLGDGLKEFLTGTYDDVKLNVNFVHTEASDGTTKFQILRRNNNSYETNWFIDLYDHNIEGNHFLIYIDKTTNSVIFDVNNPEIDNQYEFELVDSISLKEKYINWMERHEYTGQSPRKYASALNTLNKKIREIDDKINFFEYPTDLYPEIIDTIKRSEDYQTVVEKDNTTTSNALKTFEEFLKDYVSDSEMKYSDNSWIYPANSNKYDHESSFKKNGAIEWHMSSNLDVGDLVFLYSTKPFQKITHLTIVEEINILPDERKLDDSEFWKEPDDSKYTKFARLKLVEVVDNEGLSLDELKKHGLNGVPEDPVKVSDELFEYLKKYFKYFGDKSKPNNYYYRNTSEGYNKIYYGIPGCGKSYKIENEILKDVSKDNVFRTTFYLDYTNSDFIGQIMPVVNGKDITYEHIAGPFTKALYRAISTDEMVYLVIEEINRGNAAAIFGDIFQLLDRNDNCYSRYPITNEFIEAYVLKNANLNIKGNVIIPSNLTILATMNTSDQGIFPLDTAFKRRWELERVVDDEGSYTIDELMVPFTNYTWKDFRREVNKTIQTKSKEGTVSVDKQLGRWFVKENMLTSKENINNKPALDRFVNNVLDYLYSDVCKFDKSDFFDENYSFDEICRIIDAYQDGKTYDLELKIFDKHENY